MSYYCETYKTILSSCLAMLLTYANQTRAPAAAALYTISEVYSSGLARAIIVLLPQCTCMCGYPLHANDNEQ